LIVPHLLYSLAHREYTERTDGSYIEDKESSIVWHYEQADPEYGKMQASEMVKYMEKVSVGGR